MTFDNFVRKKISRAISGLCFAGALITMSTAQESSYQLLAYAIVILLMMLSFSMWSD